MSVEVQRTNIPQKYCGKQAVELWTRYITSSVARKPIKSFKYSEFRSFLISFCLSTLCLLLNASLIQNQNNSALEV